MTEKSTRQLIDDQMLSIITTWSDVFNKMEDAGRHIPQQAYDWEDETGYVCPELASARHYDELQQTLLKNARDLASVSETVGLISLDDWHKITHTLWYAGTGEPIEEDYWE